MQKPHARLSRLALGCAALTILAGHAAGFAAINGSASTPATPGSACTLCDHGAPYLDVRLRPDGFPTRSVAAALSAARAANPGASGERDAALERLRGLIAGVAVDEHEFFGTPKFVRSTQRLLTEPSKDDAGKILADFVLEYRPLFEIDPVELSLGRIARDYLTQHNGARHLTIQQQVSGADLFGCEFRANLSRTGQIINVGSTMIPRPDGGFVVPEPKIEDFAAIIAAADSVGVTITQLPVPASDPHGADLKRVWQTIAELRADEAVVTKRVYFPVDRNTIRPAWSVIIPVRGVGHTYDIIVDAVDGSILHRNNWLWYASTEPVSMRVYTSDGVAPGSPGTSTPSGDQFPLATRQLVVMNPADVTQWSPNGWINDGGTETLGNNVDAHGDLNGDNVPDAPRPNGGAARIFDFPLDPLQPPTAYTDASITQMFYFCNYYHDKLYALGFDEAAGNFQLINFSGQGTGNDRVIADCQDDSVVGAGNSTASFNNANFSTNGMDGSTGRVQMYLFNGPNPDRDGTLDGDIVYHELTHGTSIRLHGGLPNATGNQSTGMGEGWSDFIGISLLAEPTDDPNAVFSTGGYTTHQLASLLTYTSNYYFGIRRFPYSVDMTKNPHTYADIDPTQAANPPGVPISPTVGTVISNSATSVHNIGEVWCQMLMECRANLWNAHGFAGNQTMMQLVIDGMKISPINPTFIQARDAIIQADIVNNDGANLLHLWTAFAKRGMGSTATGPAVSSTSGVNESYVIPQTAVFSYPDGRPNPLAPQVASSFRVNVVGTLLSLTAGSGQMHYSVNGGPFTSVDLAETATPNQYTASLPALPCLAQVSYYFSTDTSVGVRTDPPAAPAAVYRTLVANQSPTVLTDSFETDSAWTVGPSTASVGFWTRTDPNGTVAQPEDAHSGPGTLCWVTGNGAVGGAVGDADLDGGYTTLTTPPFNLSAHADASISYWRWYSNGTGSGPYADTFRVDVSVTNGISWTRAETVGPGSASDPNVNPGWRFASWRLSDLGLVPSSNVRIRFVAEDSGTGSIVEAAIDDFSIQGVACTEPTPPCPADINGVNGVTIDDLFIYLNAWFQNCTGQPGSPCNGVNADFNASSTVTIDDLFLYLNAWFTGCP